LDIGSTQASTLKYDKLDQKTVNSIESELKEVDALRIYYDTNVSNDSKKEVREDPRAKSYYYYEQYDDFKENTFESPIEKPLSTFGIDVDNAAYSNSRRFINDGYLPPKNAVKLEEFINYFDYNLPQPKEEHPFSITTELAACPWQKDNLLMQVAIQGERIERDEQKPNNLVFLLDVSGSMDEPNKLPLLKKSLKLLVKEMREEDRIAIVVYAGASGLVLPSTSGSEKEKIWAALENLNAGGGTAGGEGIELAYKTAMKSFKKEGNNRIILATDGDFNIGISEDDALIKLIEEKRESGVFISVIGFGDDNFESSKMEKIADNGNGNFYFIDNILEAKKVLVTEMGGTLITIAKDVKLQLEFNPEYVKNYRLLGYENRMLETKDFEDDKKDAGDLGSGHSVIALYEIVPREKTDKMTSINNLRYQKKTVDLSKNLQDEFAVIKFRYKKPKSSKSILIEHIVTNEVVTKPSSVFQFSTAVTEFGLLLRESNYRGNASYNAVLKRARANKGKDENGYRAEFIQLVEKSKLMFEEYRLSAD
jgi:Ca-activated chloride channel family protein